MKNEDSKFEKNFKWLLVGVVAIMLIAIFGAVAVLISMEREIPQSEANPGFMGGLQNGNAGKPEVETEKDRKEEYEKREPLTKGDQISIKDEISNKLSRGEFSDLDTYLLKQQAAFKNGEGEDNQTIFDWATLFELYRSDLTATINMTADNAETSFKTYSCPDVLAAAIAYLPVSVKVKAFEDWSAIILPGVLPEDAAEVNMEAIALDSIVDELAKVNSNNSIKFIDIVAYDMTLYGYRCRFTALQDANGFYRPYSLICLDEDENNFMTKQNVKEIENNLPSFTSIDDIIRVTKKPDNWSSPVSSESPVSQNT